MEPEPCEPDQALGIEQRAKAQEFKNTGNDKFNKNNYKGAIVDYQKGLLHEPNNPELHTNLSAAYLHLEKYIEAEEHALFAIHLRPNFYKGYMRAAKADHGKGMTKLALKRLAQGLSNVTEPIGLKELNRLKNQYTAYLSLQSNNERELEFDSDTYQSEDDEDEGLSTDDSGDEQSPPFNGLASPAQAAPSTSPANQPPATSVSQPPTSEPLVSCDLNVSKQEPEETTEPVAVEQEELKQIPESETTEKKTTSEDKIESQVKPVEMNVSAEQKLESQKEMPSEKKPEHPFDRIRELARTSEMKKNIADFKENLKVGGQAYLSGNYRKAVDNYKSAYERVGKRYLDFETDERQCNVIRYASYAAMINLNTYDDIIKGIQGLNDMTKFGFDFPAIYIQIARAYYKLNRFKTALEPLEKLQDIIDNCPIFPTFIWPGTNDTIEETTPSGLKNSIKELNQLCRMSHKPTAVCRFENCLKTSSHILPSEVIYTNDPDFIGYVRMICEEKCHIEFHIPCWKSYKESVCGIGKINDKDFLGRRCLTTDCVNSEGDPSIIITIEIIGPDGQVKSVNKLDPKTNLEQKTAEKKMKKKKCKLDDKEIKDKVSKPKKNREKQSKTKEKKQTRSQNSQEDGYAEEEDEYPPVLKPIDPVQALQIRKESLIQLRKLKFGLPEKNYWDPQYSFYGRADESIKAANNQYLDGSNDPTEVKDAKEFLFSYFMPILKDEGPLKLTEVEDLWKDLAGDFCDMTVVLPNLKKMADLLMESNRFCQVEDRLCLADQLEETYETVKEEVVGTVTYMMTGPSSCETDSQQTDSTKDHDMDGASSSGDESDFESSSGSDESEDEGSDDEDKDDMEVVTLPNLSVPPPLVHIEPPQPEGKGKFTLNDILKEMAKMKNLLQKGSEEAENSSATSEPKHDQQEETGSNETFESIHGSSSTTTTEEVKATNATDIPSSEVCNSTHGEPTPSSQTEAKDTPVSSSADLSGEVDIGTQPQHDSEEPKVNTVLDHNDVVKPPDAQNVFENTDCDKGSQSEVVTEERHIQTSPRETKDRLSQTKESDLYKELKKKVQELNNQLSAVNKENTKLMKELVYEKQFHLAQHETITRKLTSVQEENRKSVEANKALQLQMKMELSIKDKEHKRKEDEMTKSINNMKDINNGLVQENSQLKKDMTNLLKDTADVKLSLTAALDNIKIFEASYKNLEVQMKGRLQVALQAQLNLLKACWETQLNLHKKRCVEKITEMQSWFSISPGEVESLPSYPLIQQNILQWMEMAKHLQQIESNFQAKYCVMEKKIAEGNDIEDLKPELLPAMPKEPLLPPLEKIHKEITDKHLKSISDLTQLVATQQLQIEKSKDQADQLTQLLMNTYGSNQLAAPPRMPQPLTTAFGSLALQYSYPGAVPPQFSGPTLTNVHPVTQDTSNACKLPDVQTLLQESSKLFSSPTAAPNFLSSGLKDEARSQTPPQSNAFSYPPPVVPPPPAALSPQPLPGSAVSMPPPPIGIAQNVLKNSSALPEQVKEIKTQEQRAKTPKLEQKVGSSRESTPGPTVAPTVPTPEKTKKKKKNKTGEAAAAEARIAMTSAAAVSLDTASAAVEEVARDDSSGWSVVLPKHTMPKQLIQPTGPLTECKLKNKKKLLDKLQTRFPTTPLKDIDDIVKQVREHNNGSLSGLPFDEIEARVERIITKRHLQKNSTMGLVKFSNAAWGTVKPQEVISWSNLQLEECTICLEPMGIERTKVDCNHEFHTKCLRKWLKEKSVCPLCNKFTTMPDEFPAL